MIGGRRYTTTAAVEEFIAAVTTAANGERPPAKTPAQRQRAIERAERELAGESKLPQR
jgi:hypothetical protein